eukprot:9354521-Pyramimonas_sp.AAC.1
MATDRFAVDFGLRIDRMISRSDCTSMATVPSSAVSWIAIDWLAASWSDADHTAAEWTATS